MSFLELIIFIPLIFLLETNEKSKNLIYGFLTIKMIKQIKCIKQIYTIRNLLHNYPKYISFLSFLYYMAHGYFFIKLFYSPDINISSLIPSFVTFLIAMPIFMFSKDKHHEEIEVSKFNSSLLKGLFRFVDVYNHFYTLKKWHLHEEEALLKITTFEKFDMNLLFFYILIDFAICSGCYFSTTIILLIETNFKKDIIISILKRVLYFGCIVTSFFLVYNPAIGNYVYRIAFNNLPVPSNVILYNMLPQSNDVKLRLIMHVAFYILT